MGELMGLSHAFAVGAVMAHVMGDVVETVNGVHMGQLMARELGHVMGTL